jgi:hypothetical protein
MSQHSAFSGIDVEKKNAYAALSTSECTAFVLFGTATNTDLFRHLYLSLALPIK